MQTDTIHEYLGKLVKVHTEIVTVRTHAGYESAPTYYGRVSNYDHDFITLSPFWLLPFAPSTKDILKLLKQGESNQKITIGRRTILTLEQILEK